MKEEEKKRLIDFLKKIVASNGSDSESFDYEGEIDSLLTFNENKELLLKKLKVLKVLLLEILILWLQII